MSWQWPLSGCLSALPNLHNIPPCFPSGEREHHLGDPTVIPRHSADFSRKSSQKFDHYMIIPVVEDLQLEISLDQHGFTLLVDADLPLGEEDGEAQAVVAHL